MEKNFSKNHEIGSSFTYITYNLDNVDNGNVLASIYTDLISKGIDVSGISVEVYSNDGVTETRQLYFQNIENYFEKYNKVFTDSSIVGISFNCEYNKLRFKVDVDARLKMINVTVVGKVDEKRFNLDDVISRLGMR